MSIKNKAKDRGDNGRIRRKYTGRHAERVHFANTPGWWVRLFMTRPQRRESQRLCKLLEREIIDGDEVTFPLGSRKPHAYYW